jgi:hypothetical protein
MTNKYPGQCDLCGGRVYAGDGEAVRNSGGKWIVLHDECARGVARQAHMAAMLEQYPVDADEADADAYADYVRSAVKAAYATRTQVGETDRGAWYDTTTYQFSVDPAFGLTANRVRDVLAAGDGQSMYSYGKFGGYSTIGTVHPTETPGTFTVESVYHIGD